MIEAHNPSTPLAEITRPHEGRFIATRDDITNSLPVGKGWTEEHFETMDEVTQVIPGASVEYFTYTPPGATDSTFDKPYLKVRYQEDGRDKDNSQIWQMFEKACQEKGLTKI